MNSDLSLLFRFDEAGRKYQVFAPAGFAGGRREILSETINAIFRSMSSGHFSPIPVTVDDSTFVITKKGKTFTISAPVTQ